MAWEDIKTTGIPRDPATQERRRIARIIIDVLCKNLSIQNRLSIFQLNVDRFLNSMYKQYHIPPNEILSVLLQRPDLLKAIYKNKFKKIKNALLQEDRTEEIEKTFVTIFYDRYISCKSFFRAALQAYKYPFEHFTRAFVTNIFTKYPFLRKQSHLEHIVYLLQTRKIGAAYYLTQSGIKEEYDCESIVSKMGSQ